jgi:enoyl-CoA hydratase/carnithine racemase
MKALTRIPIFSYSSIATTLLTDSKSLEIKFRNKFINLEALFEFESILTWSASHPEVQSIYITAYGDHFLQGIDPEELKVMPEEKLKKILTKLSTISQSFFCLPQTIIMDLKLGTKGVGLELALAADIRLAKEEALFSFDHLTSGLTPSCGIFSFLAPYLNQNVMRSLILSGKEFNVATMNALGGWCDTDLNANTLVKQVFAQAPIARMQAKRGLLGDNFTHEVNSKIEIERKIFNATVATRDYTQANPFMGHSEFKEKLQSQEELLG